VTGQRHLAAQMEGAGPARRSPAGCEGWRAAGFDVLEVDLGPLDKDTCRERACRAARGCAVEGVPAKSTLRSSERLVALRALTSGIEIEPASRAVLCASARRALSCAMTSDRECACACASSMRAASGKTGPGRHDSSSKIFVQDAVSILSTRIARSSQLNWATPRAGSRVGLQVEQTIGSMRWPRPHHGGALCRRAALLGVDTRPPSTRLRGHALSRESARLACGQQTTWRALFATDTEAGQDGAQERVVEPPKRTNAARAAGRWSSS